MAQLRADPFEPSLRLHPLTGKLEGMQAVSLTYSYRITLTLQSLSTKSCCSILAAMTRCAGEWVGVQRFTPSTAHASPPQHLACRIHRRIKPGLWATAPVAVNAVTLVGGRRAVVEDVAEVDAGTGAAHFDALSSFQPVGAK